MTPNVRLLFWLVGSMPIWSTFIVACSYEYEHLHPQAYVFLAYFSEMADLLDKRHAYS